MFSNSIQGINSALAAFNRSAERLIDIEKVDLPAETVNMIIAEHSVAANTVALRTSLTLGREIIDPLA
ncbi:MAG: hypothetical protein ABIJ61_03750 [bacterium]